MTLSAPASSAPPVPAVAPRLEGHALGALEALSAVDVTGTDAEAFLQGQLSNDVVALGDGRVLLAGWCSPKGRLLVAPLVHRLPEGFRLIVPADLVQGLVQRLRMFVLRASVTVAPRDDLGVVALFATVPDTSRAEGAADDSGVRRWLAEAGLEPAAALLDGEPLRAVRGDGAASALRWHDGPSAVPAVPPTRRLLAIVPAANGAQIPAAAPAHALTALTPAQADALWRLGDVRAGLPSVRAATRDAFVPQMVNFGQVGGLSFKKGCYPGQEIVARMQYLGKLKRHMRGFRAAPFDGPDGAPVPGDALDVLAPDGAVTAGGAEVVDAILTDGALELLAVVRGEVPGIALVVGDASAHGVELPYAPPAPPA